MVHPTAEKGSLNQPTHQRIPPGPHPLNPWKSNLAFQRDPLRFLSTLVQQYGDMVQFHLGPWRMYLLNHPDSVKQVLQGNAQNYDKDVALFRIIKILLGNGPGTVDGEAWRRQRHLIQPAFHKERIAAFGPLMTTATTQMLQRWETSDAECQQLDLAQEMHTLTLAIIAQTLFSSDLGHQLETFTQAFTYTNEFLASYLHFPFPPLSVPIPRHRRFLKALHTMDAVIYDLLRQRSEKGKEHRSDLLSLLLQATEEEAEQGMSQLLLRDIAMGLLIAGHETSASALTWTWCLLAQHPEVQQRLHREVDEVLAGRIPTMDDLPQLVYTRMILEETLRLYPPAWQLMRRAKEDDVIGGYDVPKGTFVFWSTYLLHRHPAFWDLPERFDPERFSPERIAQCPRHAHIPFSSGSRVCVGNSFAMAEMSLVVATMAQRYRILLVPGYQPEPEPVLTLRVRHGLPVLRERRATN